MAQSTRTFLSLQGRVVLQYANRRALVPAHRLANWARGAPIAEHDRQSVFQGGGQIAGIESGFWCEGAPSEFTMRWKITRDPPFASVFTRLGRGR